MPVTRYLGHLYRTHYAQETYRYLVAQKGQSLLNKYVCDIPWPHSKQPVSSGNASGKMGGGERATLWLEKILTHRDPASVNEQS